MHGVERVGRCSKVSSPIDLRQMMHSQSNRTTRWGHAKCSTRGASMDCRQTIEFVETLSPNHKDGRIPDRRTAMHIKDIGYVVVSFRNSRNRVRQHARGRARDAHSDDHNTPGRVILLPGTRAPCKGLLEVVDDFFTFSCQITHQLAHFLGLFGMKSMLEGIAVAARRACPHGPTVHAAPGLSGNCGRAARGPLAGFGAATQAAEHWTGVTLMISRHDIMSPGSWRQGTLG